MLTKQAVNVLPVYIYIYINKTIRCKNNRIVQQSDTHTHVESSNILGLVGILKNNILENKEVRLYLMI